MGAAVAGAPSRTGRPRQVDLREVVNALLYQLMTPGAIGGHYRLVFRKLRRFGITFDRWRNEGLYGRLFVALWDPVRELEGKLAAADGRDHRSPVGEDDRAAGRQATTRGKRSRAASGWRLRGAELATALASIPDAPGLKIVPKPEGQPGFAVLPRRWVVERFFGWLGRCRRLSEDFERTIASALAWLQLAAIRILLRRLGRAETPANTAAC